MEIRVQWMTLVVGFLTLAVSLTQVGGQGLKSCQRTGPCSCDSEKGTIDLSPLTGDGKEPGLSANAGTISTYFYNPCKNMDYGSVKNSAIFQFTSNAYYDLGTNNNNKFAVTANGEVQITFKSNDNTRTTLITLNCTPAGVQKFSFDKDKPTSTYHLILETEYACPKEKQPSDSGLSIGSYLCIGFFLLLILYVVVGVLVQVFVRKEEGLQRIPNVNLWSELPGLIKDGFKFTFTCGKGNVSYGQI